MNTTTETNTNATINTTLAAALRRAGAPSDYIERLAQPIKLGPDLTVDGVEELLAHVWWKLRDVQAEEALLDGFDDVWATVAGHNIHDRVERVGFGNAEAIARWYYDHEIRDDEATLALDLNDLD